MGRYTESVCKLCRREGARLYLKGSRCHGGKCSLEKRDYPPGMHNWRRGKISEYGKRLREKQKAKRYYGIFDKAFKKYFHIAEKMKGNTGENLLALLERRLDNAIFRGGFAHSRAQARQMVNHGHITVNGKKVDVASYLIQEGDVIKPREKDASKKMVETVQEARNAETPSWLSTEKNEIKVVQMPTREEVEIEIHEELIVEFFSR